MHFLGWKGIKRRHGIQRGQRKSLPMFLTGKSKQLTNRYWNSRFKSNFLTVIKNKVNIYFLKIVWFTTQVNSVGNSGKKYKQAASLTWSINYFSVNMYHVQIFFVLQNTNKPSAHIESVNRRVVTYQANQSMCFLYHPPHRPPSTKKESNNIKSH